MNGKRIFITGGTGFFGKSLLEVFRRNRPDGTELVILSRDPAGFLRRNPEFSGIPGVSFIPGDVRTFPPPAGRFDAVIHAATPTGAQLERDDPEELRSVIAEGTRHVLGFCRQRNIPRLLFTSSGAVYGPQEPECERMPETHPCRPSTAYGRGKREAEQLCLGSGVDTVIARCFAFIGPHLPLDGHFAAGNFIADALAGRPITIQGDGRPLRSYLYADDLVHYLWKLLETGRPGTAYNVGGGRAVSIAELALLCAGFSTPPLPVAILGAPGSGPPPRYVPDVSKTESELGLVPSVDLETAFRRTFEFHRNRSIV